MSFCDALEHDVGDFCKMYLPVAWSCLWNEQR
jgi:hypothetical protein